ncbi:MAG: hypothetical protein EBV64_01815 [Oxalobacteraceae bacterium]|nr:hypothetical protein [Oxalobacteraceae bacterium]
MAERFRVQVCYALPDVVSLLAVDLDEGQTLEQAIQASGVLARHLLRLQESLCVSSRKHSPSMMCCSCRPTRRSCPKIPRFAPA